MDEYTTETEVPQEEAVIAEDEGNTDQDDAEQHTPEEDEIDYAKRVEDDLDEIRKLFPSFYGITDISDLKNPLRFGALRDLGLTVKEAFLASGGARSVYDNRAHLTASVPKRASSGIEMTRKEYEVVKDLFSSLSDSEIKKLYQRATK